MSTDRVATKRAVAQNTATTEILILGRTRWLAPSARDLRRHLRS
jgi:hypothetical protein